MNIESKIKEAIPLAPFTTFKIGGPAKYYFEIETKEDFKEAYAWAKEKKEKIYILGGGSNVLINDDGVNGLVIVFNNREITVHGERIECGAGAYLASVSSIAISNNLSGLEWSTGIPRATIGGAIRGNAEAFDCPVSAIVETVLVFQKNKKDFVLFSNKDCKFNYRNSIFKMDNNLLILNTTLKFKKNNHQNIKDFVQKAVDFRNDKYPKLPSAGSVFENLDPEYVKMNNLKLYEKAVIEGKTKRGQIGVGYIIDLLGLRGKTIGGAKISLEHANHIVNTGNAKADEVIMLISYIKQQVRDKFKIQLKEEIQYFGFE